jgi:hypothetical protein
MGAEQSSAGRADAGGGGGGGGSAVARPTPPEWRDDLELGEPGDVRRRQCHSNTTREEGHRGAEIPQEGTVE